MTSTVENNKKAPSTGRWNGEKGARTRLEQLLGGFIEIRKLCHLRQGCLIEF